MGKKEDIEILERFHTDPIAISSVEDGWMFSISEEVLEDLLKQAKESEVSRVVVFLKSPEGKGN